VFAISADECGAKLAKENALMQLYESGLSSKNFITFLLLLNGTTAERARAPL
jgi:hypothetical protein